MNPEGDLVQQRKMKAAAKKKALTQKKPVKNVVQVKVLDFTIWKGFKFGFGFALGGLAVSLLLTFVAFFVSFGLHMFFLGFFTSMGSPV